MTFGLWILIVSMEIACFANTYSIINLTIQIQALQDKLKGK